MTSDAAWTIRFKNYLPLDDQMEVRLRRVIADMDRLPDSALHIDEVARVITIDYSQAKDWLQTSRQVLHTIRVGECIVVCPPWDKCDARPSDIVLWIDPGVVFGSGLHESTRLCLRILEHRLISGCSVVDFGTGSGILAIAAARLGASRVIAFDGDSDAIDAAKANVERNGVQGIVEVHLAESPGFIGSQVDLVTANITAETISAHLHSISSLLRGAGVLIASGMTTANAAHVEDLLPGAGLALTAKLTDGQWVAIVATRN